MVMTGAPRGGPHLVDARTEARRGRGTGGDAAIGDEDVARTGGPLDALDALTPEELHQVYKMLRLKILANARSRD